VGVAVVKVLHLAGVEINVSTADADSFDLDNDITRPRHRWFDFVDARLVRSRDDEGPHRSPMNGRTSNISTRTLIVLH
jgi:hypothetical protein